MKDRREVERSEAIGTEQGGREGKGGRILKQGWGMDSEGGGALQPMLQNARGASYPANPSTPLHAEAHYLIYKAHLLQP